LLAWLACLPVGLVWLAVPAVLWWWLPSPARTTLATSDPLLLLGFSPDGETLVTVRPAPTDKKITGDPLADFILRGISPTYSGPIQAWDVRTGTEWARFAEDWEHIAHAELAPKGDFLAADDGAGTLKVWDLRTGQERGVLKAAGLGSYDERHTFWFSPDGRTLAYKTAGQSSPFGTRPPGSSARRCRGTWHPRMSLRVPWVYSARPSPRDILPWRPHFTPKEPGRFGSGPSRFPPTARPWRSGHFIILR
jgi:hypothetical protein